MFSLIVCTCVLTTWLTVDATVVLTTSGPVRGALYHDNGVSYYAYQGIPYAESPTGDLRFKPPVPKTPWSEIRDATKPGPACPQPEGKIARNAMSEDCLNVNVFVPAYNSDQPRHVLVYVHGGAFKMNSGNIDDMFGPQLLLSRGIIYVSMNFRLGSLGFLSLETDESSGNMGLKDLLLALQWVKNNIHKFGGGTITIGGQSSGSAMVHHMLLTEKSTGLFDRAILNSGSATNYRFLSQNPRDNALALANELGVQTDDDILSKLQEANVFDIIDAQESIYKDRRNIMRPAFAPFVPCVEKESEHSILTKAPYDIINSGIIPQNVPILAGLNSREGVYMWPNLHKQPETFLKEQFPLGIPEDIEYPKDSDEYNNLVNSISELYFGDINLTNFTLNNFYDYLSDAHYTYCVGSWIKTHKQRKNSEKLFYYEFNFDGELNWAKVTYNISFPGVAHADEIGYVFVNRATKEKLKHLNKRSQQTLNNMLTYVSNFVKFGDPTPACRTGRVMWPEHGDSGRHLVINDRPASSTPAPFEERFAFWTRVYKQHREYLKSHFTY